MSRSRLSRTNPSCELRTLGVRNSATTVVASATATATAAQPDFDKELIIKEIKAAREKATSATKSATGSATFEPFSEGSSCALDKSHSEPGAARANVIIGPWAPATSEQVAEERHRVLEAEPRKWWWRPRYRLAQLERSGMAHDEAVALVRAEEA